MTNISIIITECEIHGITEEVATYQEWQRRGYQVQKGQKALFDTMIWMPRKKGVNQDDSADVTEENKSRFFMKKAYFFGESQVQAK